MPAPASPKLFSRFGGVACPCCGAALAVQELSTGKQSCAACGGAFEGVHFVPPIRRTVVKQIAEAGPGGAAPCARHQHNAAVGSCERCGNFLCALCRINTDRFLLCPACFERLQASGALKRTLRSMPHTNGITAAYVAGDIDHEGIIRHRVFYEDILFVTHHRCYGTGFVTVFSLLAGSMLLAALAVALTGYYVAAGMLFLLACAASVPLFLRIASPLDVVTVFGKRCKAVMNFNFKKELARQLFEKICALTQERQEQLAAQTLAENPPPAEPSPPPAVNAALPDQAGAEPASPAASVPEVLPVQAVPEILPVAPVEAMPESRPIPPAEVTPQPETPRD